MYKRQLGRADEYYNEDLLYKMFGVNAELLIDHAWGWEPCRISDIKAYRPKENSMGSGQVLQSPYDFARGRIVVQEMAEALSLDLVDKGLTTDQLVLTVGYDRENLTDPRRRRNYRGEVVTDPYGRSVPKHAHGTENLKSHTASTAVLLKAANALYDRLVDPALLVRRITLNANHILQESEIRSSGGYEQLDLFTDYEALKRQRAKEKEASDKERRMQQALLDIKKKYGKNAVLKGTSYQEGATAKERNGQIGGHRA